MRFGLDQYDPENYTPEPAPLPEPNWAEQRQAAFAQPEPAPTPPWESTWAEERAVAFPEPAADLAPDFLRQIPTSAIEEDHRQAEADNVLQAARKDIAARFVEISQADIRAHVAEIAGEAAAGAGGMLDQWRDDLLGQIPQEVTSGQRLLNPLEALSMAGTAPGSPLALSNLPGHVLAKGAAFGGEPDPLLEFGLNVAMPLGIPGKAATAARGVNWADAMSPEVQAVVKASNLPPPPGPGMGGLAQKGLRWIEEAFSDRYAAINRVGPRTEALNTLLQGKVGGGLQRAEDEIGPAYGELADDLEPRLEALNTYRTMNSYLEAAAGKMNPFRKGTGGITSVEDAQKVMDELLTKLDPETKAAMLRADDLTNQAMRGLLEDEVNAGLVPRELADNLNQMYPHYNPIVHTKFLEKAANGTAGGTLRQMTNTLKRLTEEGSEDDILPPMQAIIKTTLERDAAIRRNTLLNTMVDEGKFPATPSITMTTGPEIKRAAEPGFPTALEDWTRRRDEARAAAGVSGGAAPWQPPQGFTLSEVGGRWRVVRDPKVKLAPDEFGPAQDRVHDWVIGEGGMRASTGSRAGVSGYLPEGWKPPEAGTGDTRTMTQKMREWYDENPKPESPVATVAQARGRVQAGKLNFMKDGKPWDADVPDDLARALDRMSHDQLSSMEAGASALNRSLRMGATALNPAFLATNLIRDYVGAWIREGVTPPELVGGLEDALLHGPLWRQNRRLGGSYGGAGGYYGGPEQQKALKQVEQDIIKQGGIPLQQLDLGRLTRAIERRDPKEAAKFLATLGPIREVGEAIEQAPRLATLGKRLAKGEEDIFAGQAGKRVTIDFDRAGDLVKHLNALVPFLNPQIQGGLTAARTIRDVPQAKLRLAGLATAITGIYFWNKQFPEYGDVANYIKDGFLPIMVPMQDSEAKANGLGYEKMQLVTVPLGSYAGLAVAIEEGLNALNGDSHGAIEATGRVINATSPVAGEGVSGALMGLAPVTAPGKVAFEQAANYDYFRGRAIESESMEGMLPENRYTERTSELAKRIAEELPDEFKLSPVRIDHIIQGTTAGAGRLATQAISTGVLGQETENAPVAGGLLAGVYRTYGGGEIENRAYSDRDKMFGSLASQYRPLIRTIEEVTGTGSLGRAPTRIQKTVDKTSFVIPLLPAEQAAYQARRLAAIQDIWKEGAWDTWMATEPPDVRRDAVRKLVTMGGDIAEAWTLAEMSNEELEKRLNQAREAPRGRSFPKAEFQPVGTR